MAENTIVIFASDHGDMMGERGMWFKKTLFEPAIRVPLIMRGPGIPRGRVGTAVSLLDLLPTFVDFLRAGPAPFPRRTTAKASRRCSMAARPTAPSSPSISTAAPTPPGS